MDPLDLLVLKSLLAWRRAGQHAVLFTVVRTWGSSPRPVGALMAMSDRAEIVGSVSGGCVEDDLQYRFRDLSRDHAGCKRLTYGVSADEAHRFGLPCGGTLELVAEFDPAASALEELVARMAGGELVRRTLRLGDGGVVLAHASVPQALSLQADVVARTFGPGLRMLLIGAGQLAEYLATMALFNGFAVTVCDPREEYRGSWSVPGVRVVGDMPDDAVTAFKPDMNCAIIALTHDPKLDDLALMDALGTTAMYVGAIGSRRNSEARRQRLAEHFDIGPEALSRLHSPIGLYIGSKTPSEIAVSIMAEVLAVKNGVGLPEALSITKAKDALEIE